MDDFNRRREENKPGKYFVGDECISCAVCWKAVPNCFASHEIHTFAYIYRQPRTLSEELECEDVLKLCPVQAIAKEN